MKDKELRSYLLKCGHEDTILDQFFNPADDADPDIDQLSAEFTQAQREVFRNDPDFIKPLRDELETSIKGKERGSVERSIMRAFGITSDEAKENGLGESYDKLLKFASEKAGKSKDKTVEEVQNELKKALDRVKLLEEEEIPKLKNTQNEEIAAYFKRMHVEKLLDKYTDKLVAKPSAFLPGLREYLNEKYTLDLTEDRSDLVIKTKEGTEPLSEDKLRKLTKDDIVASYLDKVEAIKKSHGGEPPQSPKTGGKTPVTGEQPKYELPGMKAAQKAAEIKPRIVGQ